MHLALAQTFSAIVGSKKKLLVLHARALTVQISTPSRKLLAGEEALHASTGNAAHTASATSSTPGDPADVWLQSYSKCESFVTSSSPGSWK